MLIVAALLSLDQSLIQSSLLTPTVGEVLDGQVRCPAFFDSHCMTGSDPILKEPINCIYQNEPSQLDLSTHIIPRLRSQSTLPSLIQISPALLPTSLPLNQTQRAMQVTANIYMKILATARELKFPPQRETSSLFLDEVPFYSFFNTLIPFRELFEIIPNLRHVLEGLK